MSLWLQAVLESLEGGDYAHVREQLLPCAPIPLPGCLAREFEFAERHCRDIAKNRFFPIRFLWALEANEQRLFGFSDLGRSRYHPEKLLDLWERASSDLKFRREREAEGYQFDFAEKAVELTVGWIYIGDSFAQDFLEIEATLGVELLFPDPSDPAKTRPVFQALKPPRNPRHIILISCVKRKGRQPAKSQDLYESDLFRKSLAYARSLEPDAIYIVSAKYHLLDLDRQIEWYDETLNKMKIADVKVWAGIVLQQLGEVADLGNDSFTVLASDRYRRFLLPHLTCHSVPMMGMGIGKKLQFLKEKIA